MDKKYYYYISNLYAKKYSSIPPSLTPSERAIWTSGNIITAKSLTDGL